MAEAILKYNLDNPDDRMAHMRAVKSTDMAIALFEIVNNSKREFVEKIEQGSYDNSYDLLKDVYEKIWQILEDEGINLEDIIN
jgi:uncharacterized protein (DUF1015 family)